MFKIRAPWLPADSRMIWTPFVVLVRNDEASRLADIVSADPDVRHFLLDAYMMAAVALSWAFIPITWNGVTRYGMDPGYVVLWALMSVIFLGFAYKSGVKAIADDRISKLESQIESGSKAAPQGTGD